MMTRAHCTQCGIDTLANMIRALIAVLLCCRLISVEPTTQRTVADNGDIVLTTTTQSERGELTTVQIFSPEGFLKERRNPNGITKQYWADREGRIIKCAWKEGGLHRTINVAYEGDEIIALVDELGNKADVRGLGFSWVAGELVREHRSPIH